MRALRQHDRFFDVVIVTVRFLVDFCIFALIVACPLFCICHHSKQRGKNRREMLVVIERLAPARWWFRHGRRSPAIFSKGALSSVDTKIDRSLTDSGFWAALDDMVIIIFGLSFLFQIFHPLSVPRYNHKK